MYKPNLKTILLIGLIIFISIFPRLWKLEQKPPIIVDEYANIRMIKSLLENRNFNPLEFHWDYSKTIFTYYPTILLIKLTGTGNDLFYLRLTSVIYSILALIPFFLLTRRLTTNVTAFATTLLFANSYYFLQFSRVGWIDITFGVASGLFLILFLQKAFDRKENLRLNWVVASGITAGIIFHAYRGANVLIFLSYSYLIFLLFTNHISFKKSFMTFGLFFFTFLFISLPWLIKISKNLDKYNLRANVVYIKKTGFWLLIIITTIIFGQILTVHPPNGARGLIMLPSYYIIASIFFYKIHEVSGKSKVVLAGITLLSFIFSIQDFLFYQFWMEWIKV